ncbi:MAG: hypothetical protein A2649_03005 [Candidatus Yanofskybacteria bacterium RIFCSPHIGHO2_01_FULL_41_26]|uniref:Uncharacterized protein n=1 Tax=Candidatus Yanofskybacteria bacterium RIFCSPHIGHO2_01_FULL_41_26 TaxID=1802661 RepID=A0A1F8EBF9_9BACT|nr:MAG: hypothetical protein A2649_03005 [Candidatus Yanofskybacteria bacterium RIFCSPHIGHO2_01_FULL_41_26]
MRDLLKILPILGLSIITGLWFNFFNFRFLFSKIKSGNYKVPFLRHVFEGLPTFTMSVWVFNALFCYIPATILVAYSYKMSVENFNGLSSALIVGHATSILVSILFIRLMAGEALNKNGWIAVALVLLALPFAANSSVNVKP